MRVLITYNEPVLPLVHGEADSEREVMDAVEAVADHLSRAGLDIKRAGVGTELEAIRDGLREWPPDVVFNLFEGLGNDPHSEIRFAQILEDERVAYTGCSSRTLWQAGRKDIAKGLFRQAGLPTADFYVVEDLPLAAFEIEWPAFVKPAFRDASIGIDQRSVVTDRTQLEKQVARVAGEQGFPILVEHFVHGREISVAMIDWPELRVLPPVETLFASNNGDWPICTYNSKWDPESQRLCIDATRLSGQVKAKRRRRPRRRGPSSVPRARMPRFRHDRLPRLPGRHALSAGSESKPRPETHVMPH
jgi:D-alanine-D-alanine ligase